MRVGWLTVSLLLAACTFEPASLVPGVDAGPVDTLAASDARGFDAQPADAELDGGFGDTGQHADATFPDAQPDAAAVDVGFDAGGHPDAEPLDTGPAPDPFALGSFPVIGLGEEIVARGSREIPVALDFAESSSPTPLVVLLPGFQLNNGHYAELARHLASHGFAVARASPPAGLLSVNNLEMAADVLAVLDHLLAGPQSARLDPGRICVGGHSLGGKVAAMVANQDRRVSLLLGLDPVNGAVPVLGYTNEVPDIVPSALERLTIPVGFLGELVDTQGTLGQACAPQDQNYATFYDAALASPWAGEWTISGADHTDFIDDRATCGAVCRLCQEGPRNDEDIRRLVRGLSTAFLLRHFSGRLELDLLLANPDPVVTVRRRF